MYLLAMVRLDENRLRHDFTGIHLLRLLVDELIAFGESSLENVANKQNKNTHCNHSVATFGESRGHNGDYTCIEALMTLAQIAV